MNRIPVFLFALTALAFTSSSVMAAGAGEAMPMVEDGKTVNMGFDPKTGSFFKPTQITVPAGTTVTFANTDAGNHNVVFKDGTTSGRMRHHTDWKRTFTAPGSYPFECSIHGAAMSGTIVVK